jgi:transposase-like protein
MPVPPRTFASEVLADARYRYEETKEPVAEIADRLGIGERTLYSNIRTWGWRQRRPAGAKAANAQAANAQAAGAPAASGITLSPLELEVLQAAETVQSTAQRGVAAIGLIVAKLGPAVNTAEAERIARTLATFTRTLQEVLRLTTPYASSDESSNDRGPDDPAEFAQELVRRIGEFARSRQALVHHEPAAGLS